MKEMRGTASAAVGASRERCVRFLAAVGDYPRWYPETVREVQVLEYDRDHIPRQVRARLHVARGPLVRDFDLTMAVRVDPQRSVTLERLRHDAEDAERFTVAWSVEQEGRLRVELDATLSVPRMTPLGGLADAMARGFVDAAATALGDASAPAPADAPDASTA